MKLIDRNKVITSTSSTNELIQIETERLLMRPHKMADADFMLELNSDPEVMKYLGGEVVTMEQVQQTIVSLIQQFEERRMGRFIVIEKNSNEPIGWCGLKWFHDRKIVDIGYRFLKKTWGKGFATEASYELLKYGFNNLDLDVIYAQADPENIASNNVLKKLGLKKTGSCNEGSNKCIEFKILKTEFLNSRPRQL
jgi:ribosomal-protein-alanine N-acetyltransferase